MPVTAPVRKTRHPSITFLPHQTRCDGVKQDMYLIMVPRGTARYRRIALTEDEAVMVLVQLIGQLRKVMPELSDQLRRKIR